MVDNSGLVGGGGGKTLIIPKVEGKVDGTTGLGEFVSTGDITGYGADKTKAIALFLPKITNAARDFTTTGNFTYGYLPDNGSFSGYKPRLYEQLFRNFTIDTGHQVTIPNETIAIIRASETITIGGNGIVGSSTTNSGCFLAYPYDHAYHTSGAAIGKGGGGASGAGNSGGGQPQKTSANTGATGGDAGGFGPGGGTTLRSALVLIANTITVNGNITFNGTNGSTPGSTSGGIGGGHGGYVYLIANTINYNGGAIDVSGGNGTNGGTGTNTGGGGGGHCAILYTHAKTYLGSSTTITANVGTGGAGNGAGFAGSDGGYPYPTLSTGEYKIEGAPF